jgi:formate dehydrogenase iron-sulfur subunit
MSSDRPTTVYVPCDSSALSLGANAVAEAIIREAARRHVNSEKGADSKRHAETNSIKLIRNGSRGLYWLEPMVEVTTARGRVAYGPVSAADVPSLFDAGFLDGRDHRLSLGLTEEIPYLKRQSRVTFARVGITDPISLDDYRAHGGYRGLARAIAMSAAEIVREVTVSNLRGRGGAAFPAGIKWKTTLEQNSKQKYVVCNADEGDSGTFSDRMIMEGDPFVLIEGMTIAGVAVGASEGYIYLRSEYPHALRTLTAAIEVAMRVGYLGDDILGSGKAFHLEIRVGGGAYICGEETALLESLEGKRGVIRFKPPLPAVAGLFGQPTVVNNVITLASIPAILDLGGNAYNEFGTGRSRGTIPLQLAGNVKRPGLFELPFGLTLRELIEDLGGGTASGRPLRAVQVGGPLGAYFPNSMLDLAIDYEAMAGAGGLLGHGGVVVFDDTADLAQMARYAMEFCALESCGKCTPCRIGSTRGVEVIDRIIANRDRSDNVELLRDLCETMTAGSLCALGGLTPLPVMSALKHFPEDFGLPSAKSASIG